MKRHEKLNACRANNKECHFLLSRWIETDTLNESLADEYRREQSSKGSRYGIAKRCRKLYTCPQSLPRNPQGWDWHDFAANLWILPCCFSQARKICRSGEVGFRRAPHHCQDMPELIGSRCLQFTIYVCQYPFAEWLEFVWICRKLVSKYGYFL